MKKEYSAQIKFQKEKMSVVKGMYKNDLVDDFKVACNYFNKTQSEIIRESMKETISQFQFTLFSQISDLKSSVEMAIHLCEKNNQDELCINAIIRYKNYLRCIDDTVKNALNERHNIYVINGNLYITDGYQMGEGISTNATFVKRIDCPRIGTDVIIVDESLPFWNGTDYDEDWR